MSEEKKFEAYDSEGKPIEGVLSPEEIKELQNKAEQAELLQKEIEDSKEKLSKLENKDFNFRRLEQMTKEEKEKLSADEIAIKEKQEELEEKQKSMENNFISDIKNDIIYSMAGEDEELKKKIEFNYSRLTDSSNAKSREEIKKLLDDAYVLSTGVKSRNPIFSANNASGTTINKKEKMSESISEVGKKLGLTSEDLEKFNN